VVLVRTDLSEELCLLHALALLHSILQLPVTVNVVLGSVILFTVMMEMLRSSETPFYQELHGATSQKTTFFIVTAVRTSDLT
jgi:hypothetical protein